LVICKPQNGSSGIVGLKRLYSKLNADRGIASQRSITGEISLEGDFFLPMVYFWQNFDPKKHYFHPLSGLSSNIRMNWLQDMF
jgi:hypothetical protein